MRSAVESFLAAELAQVEQLSQAESLADKLAAADKATGIVSNFASSPEGRRAKEILATFAKDKELKSELAAKRLDEAALKITDPGRRSKAMEGVVKKFPDTEYGKKATQPTEDERGGGCCRDDPPRGGGSPACRAAPLPKLAAGGAMDRTILPSLPRCRRLTRRGRPPPRGLAAG